MEASLAGEIGKSMWSGGRAAVGRPAPPDHVLLRTLVENIGRQRFSRSVGKSRWIPPRARTAAGPANVGENHQVAQNVAYVHEGQLPGFLGGRITHPVAVPGRGRGRPRPAAPEARRHITAHRPSLRDGAPRKIFSTCRQAGRSRRPAAVRGRRRGINGSWNLFSRTRERAGASAALP